MQTHIITLSQAQAFQVSSVCSYSNSLSDKYSIANYVKPNELYLPVLKLPIKNYLQHMHTKDTKESDDKNATSAYQTIYRYNSTLNRYLNLDIHNIYISTVKRIDCQCCMIIVLATP